MKKLGTIKQSTSFMTTYVGKKWTKLKYKGQTGYILSKELTYYAERANPYDSAVTISKCLTKSQIAKFKKESYNPAKKQANRMKKMVQAWDLYTKSAYNMIDVKYTEARE